MGMGEEVAEHAEDVEEGMHMETEHSSADVDRVAWLAVVQVVRMEPCVVSDVGLEDRYRSQKNCCGCNHSGHGIADREASCNHTLAGQVVGGSSLSSQRRRRLIRFVDDAACVSGDALLVAAPPVEMARGDLNFLLKPRSAGDSYAGLVLLDRDRRLVRSPADLVGMEAVRTVHPAETNHSD